ncbi:hypothetical protein [Sulfuracidifex metallicus]|uniref:hypothetical protein n=1 Tax=Sulfuracidifex metallicus TaxID=47303 RepID=UPI002273D487|nr:hypothetical protein [Sulfuracidifex metallicus]MCY0850628.1 hypothetical protein [Sulfuracidifex metallicus]
MSRATNNKKTLELPGVYRSWYEIMTWIEMNEDFGPVGTIEGLSELENLLKELSFDKMKYDSDTDIYERNAKEGIYRVYIIKSSCFIAGELFPRENKFEKIARNFIRKLKSIFIY